MLRDAINEIRLHPGRFVATLLAVAISVGFISAIMIGVRTEENSMMRSGVIAVSKSDVVVEQTGTDRQIRPEEILETIQGASGVTKAEASLSATFPMNHGDFSTYANAIMLPSPEFRWASLAEGTWPSGEGEITLAKAGAEKLHVKVGDEITTGSAEGEGGTRYRVVGVTNDAPSLYLTSSYVTGFGPDRQASMWVVKAQDPAAAVASIQRALEPFGADNFKVRTTDDYRADQMKQLTGGFDVFRNLLLGFAAISAVVGTIIIANTFTILVTQRRRQIGLLRAVGASPGQVAGRLFAEAVLLGLVGSLLGVGIGAGVAAAAGIWTGAIYWGLVLPFGELGIAVLAGVLITVLSMIGPSLAATRVSPLEALQVVPSASRVKRLGITRGVFCCLFLLLGGGLVFQAFVNPAIGLLWAIGGGGFLSLAILLAVALTAVLWYFRAGPGKRVTIPAVAGQTYEQALSSLREEGLTARRRNVYSDTVPSGSVVSTDPGGGGRVHPSRVVTVTVSRGVEQVTVPDLSGLSAQEARRRLGSARLVYREAAVYSESVDEGRVVSQSVAADTAVNHDSAVTVTISKGRQPIRVPNVVGKSEADANNAIRKAGLTVSRQEEHSDTVAQGVVISQDPSKGTVHRGDSVTVVVSQGPELVDVPNVVDMRREEATTTLQNAGFQVQADNVFGGYFGIVRSQSPAAGTKARKGTGVKIAVF